MSDYIRLPIPHPHIINDTSPTHTYSFPFIINLYLSGYVYGVCVGVRIIIDVISGIVLILQHATDAVPQVERGVHRQGVGLGCLEGADSDGEAVALPGGGPADDVGRAARAQPAGVCQLAHQG